MLEVFPNGSKGYPKDLNMFGVHPSISKNSIIEKSYHIEDPLLYFTTSYNLQHGPTSLPQKPGPVSWVSAVSHWAGVVIPVQVGTH